jgi:hypothetical protein
MQCRKTLLTWQTCMSFASGGATFSILWACAPTIFHTTYMHTYIHTNIYIYPYHLFIYLLYLLNFFLSTFHINVMELIKQKRSRFISHFDF